MSETLSGTGGASYPMSDFLSNRSGDRSEADYSGEIGVGKSDVHESGHC